ncbi:4-(cytidine 5'-diphospho)-2-C-methyl-D-erythritol kinase [Psychrobacter sp. BF1]|uniref:4-(cytidine 5'-diphospho)-2-C-methyl-D-erythritol kinase n=1 Tax=Psychrobacter sp. BF1 TaxID=2821147 RepID=UPI001C4DFF48|nr:4-(cytidine 5'-diphospho)-2-C-methyl-D-erythritol kinase [Psychrobacter sp. BF1]
MISDHNIPNSSITRLSPAKINLFLHITAKRADGYHNLQTVFRLLDWGDYLHFLLTDKVVNIDGSLDINKLCSQLLVLTGADAITTSVEDNLIFKAARALVVSAIQSNKLPKQLPQVQVTLDKRLPMGAGLGGGSSNAATTLLALNEIWQLNFDKNEQIKIGATIGADVPIFIFGQDAIAMGIGEQLTAIDLPNQHYLLLTPDAHVDTAKLFAHAKLQRDMASISVATIKDQFTAYTQNLIAPYENVFTPVVTRLAPEVDEALKYLQRLQKVALGTARMTGSGSAVFLPLDATVASDEKLLAKWLEEAPCTGYIVGSL